MSDHDPQDLDEMKRNIERLKLLLKTYIVVLVLVHIAQIGSCIIQINSTP